MDIKGVYLIIDSLLLSIGKEFSSQYFSGQRDILESLREALQQQEKEELIMDIHKVFQTIDDELQKLNDPHPSIIKDEVLRNYMEGRASALRNLRYKLERLEARYLEAMGNDYDNNPMGGPEDQGGYRRF